MTPGIEFKSQLSCQVWKQSISPCGGTEWRCNVFLSGMFRPKSCRYQQNTIKVFTENLWLAHYIIKTISGQGSPAKNELFHLRLSQMIKV